MFEENRYFTLRADDQGTQYVQCGDEALAIPIDEGGNILFAVEPAPAFGQEIWNFPGGTVEPGEPHEATANRELREELGFAARRLDYLGEMWPWPKYLAVRSYVYLARDLIHDPLVGDEGYAIGVERVPLNEVDALIATGKIRDARVIAGLALVRAFLRDHP